MRGELVTTYTAWAAERLVLLEGHELHPDLVRADYIAWHVERKPRHEPRSKQRAAILAAGGRCLGVKDELRYLDVALAGPLPDSGYRVPIRGGLPDAPHVGAGAVDAALVALYQAGLVTDTRALDRAWLQLTDAPGRLCGACGRLTRQPDRHRACS